ncbi:hypothetical protein EC973_008438 [Apophysomyces ossiformis]|uniref:Uncharacterized protein n=1 Tax=Apophysomyces ossiformis TaxID=679940 RepID=A0A8H7BSJ8_9FUNG|nr:hypothetical protein EC973_008438 [Apophysomyces ossiformis]
MHILGLLVNLSFVAIASARTEGSIENCPSLHPRDARPTNVRDLRPDDIKVIAAMGDSFMAGFGAKGIQGNILNISSLFEYRGGSFGAGGDNGIATLPNFIKRYNPNLLGASVGEHMAEYCEGSACMPRQYNPVFDRLNAAQSGSMMQNLAHQIDYVLEGLKNYPGVNYEEDWKLINVLIGTVDQCYSCISSYYSFIAPEVYGKTIENMLTRIHEDVPRVIVNLIGTYNISQAAVISAGQKYCEPFDHTDFELNQLECWCIHSAPSRKVMNKFVASYNEQLRRKAEKFNNLHDPSFGVIYSPSPVNITSFPVEALSDIDCLHPSLRGHEWSSKALWRNMFLPLSAKAEVMNWNDYQSVYCPAEEDRFQIE